MEKLERIEIGGAGLYIPHVRVKAHLAWYGAMAEGGFPYESQDNSVTGVHLALQNWLWLFEGPGVVLLFLLLLPLWTEDTERADRTAVRAVPGGPLAQFVAEPTEETASEPLRLPADALAPGYAPDAAASLTEVQIDFPAAAEINRQMLWMLLGLTLFLGASAFFWSVVLQGEGAVVLAALGTGALLYGVATLAGASVWMPFVWVRISDAVTGLAFLREGQPEFLSVLPVQGAVLAGWFFFRIRIYGGSKK